MNEVVYAIAIAAILAGLASAAAAVLGAARRDRVTKEARLAAGAALDALSRKVGVPIPLLYLFEDATSAAEIAQVIDAEDLRDQYGAEAVDRSLVRLTEGQAARLKWEFLHHYPPSSERGFDRRLEHRAIRSVARIPIEILASDPAVRRSVLGGLRYLALQRREEKFDPSRR